MATEITTITKETRIPPMDYELLRSEGLAHIEKLSGKIWTDFNVHDPGITLLELLAYAITDLGHRTGLANEDIFAVDVNGGEDYTNSFYTAKQILPNNPQSVTDLRKLLIDIDGIRNAWVYVVQENGNEVNWWVDYTTASLSWAPGSPPSPEEIKNLNGYMRVVLEYEQDIVVLEGDTDALAKQAEQSDLIDEALAALQLHRNLCEEIRFVDASDGIEQISLISNIELTPEADPESVLAQIYFNIEKFIAPTVPYYTMEELLEQGLRVDEIFEGFYPSHGFMISKEVEAIQKREKLFVSDLIQIIMDVEGVVSLNSISIDSKLVDVNGVALGSPWGDSHPDDWELELYGPLNGGDYQLAMGDIEAASDVSFVVGNTGVVVQLDRAARKLDGLRLADRDKRSGNNDADLPVPEGEYTDLSEYVPVQNELPLIYGTGPEGLSVNETAMRKAQARQLKAYLLFFEQLLANYFAQLAQVKDLLSWDDVNRTYFTQLLSDIRDLGDLYIGGSLNIADMNEMVEITEGEGFLDRRNRFLNHLMARFSESMTDYSLVMYAMYRRPDVIDDKEIFLGDYELVSKNRGKGFDYTNPVYWDTDNVTGFERRAGRLLGFEDITRRFLFSLDPTLPSSEGMHLVEHILIRPRFAGDALLDVGIEYSPDYTCQPDKDPYSFRATVFIPGELERAKDYRFRFHAENVMRREIPAHIALDVRWLDTEDMQTFEECWNAFLEKLSTNSLAAGDVDCVVNSINNLPDMYESSYAVTTAKNEDEYYEGDVIAALNEPDPGVNTVSAEWLGANPQFPILGTTDVWPTGFILIENSTLATTYSANIGDIVCDSSVEFTQDPVTGVLTPGTVQVASMVGSTPIDATWRLTIRTLNDLGVYTIHQPIIKVLNDKECVYTVEPPKPVDAHAANDLLAAPTDVEGTIITARILTTAGTPYWTTVPPGMVFNNVNGEFRVSATPTDLIPGSYKIKVSTHADDGGYTLNELEIVIREDNESVYTLPLSCGNDPTRILVQNLTGVGTVIATVTDVDGGVVSALYLSGTMFPPFMTLDNATGIIALNDTHFIATGNTDWVIPGIYTATIETTDFYGGKTTHILTIEIAEDTPAQWTINDGHSVYCYCPGSVFAFATDADGATGSFSGIVSSTVVSGTFPPGLTLHDDGSITVNPPAEGGSEEGDPEEVSNALARMMGGSEESSDTGYRSAAGFGGSSGGESEAYMAMEMAIPQLPTLPVACDNDLVPGTYSFSVETVDVCGGITVTSMTVNIYPDRDPLWQVSAPKSYLAYVGGEVLARPTDPDGNIVWAALSIPGALDGTGLKLNTSNGEIYVDSLKIGGNMPYPNGSFRNFFQMGRSVRVLVQTIDECGGFSETEAIVTVNPDSPSVYTIDHNAILYAGNYGIGDVVARVNDQDQFPTDIFSHVWLDSGIFIGGAELDSTTGEFRVEDPFAPNGPDVEQNNLEQ